VAITVINHADAEELFRYDALVLCPPSFNVTLRVPNSAHPLPLAPLSRDNTGGDATTFEVRLSDPVQTHSIYLTHIEMRSNGYHDDSVEHDVDDGDEEESVSRKSEAVVIRSTMSSSLESTQTSSTSESTIFAVLSSVVLVSVIALTVTLIHVDPTTADGVRRLQSPLFGTSSSSCFQPSARTPALPPYGYSYCDSRDTCRRTGAADNDDEATASLPQVPPPPRAPTSSSAARCDEGKQRKHHDSRGLGLCASSSSPSNVRVLVLVYATLWIAYSLAATFTAVSIAVGVLVRSDVNRIRSTADNFRTRSDPQILANQSIMSAVDRHRRSELRRHARRMIERHRACETHVDRLYAAWAGDIDSSMKALAGDPCTDCRRLSALSKQLEQRYTDRANDYVKKLTEYERTLRGRVDDALRQSVGKYNIYLKAVAESPWTSFVANSLFNGTLLPISDGSSRPLEPHVIHAGFDSSFGVAFEVDEVSVVHRWSNRFWQR
jgi:hypothetical protein